MGDAAFASDADTGIEQCPSDATAPPGAQDCHAPHLGVTRTKKQARGAYGGGPNAREHVYRAVVIGVELFLGRDPLLVLEHPAADVEGSGAILSEPDYANRDPRRRLPARGG